MQTYFCVDLFTDQSTQKEYLFFTQNPKSTKDRKIILITLTEIFHNIFQ